MGPEQLPKHFVLQKAPLPSLVVSTNQLKRAHAQSLLYPSGKEQPLGPTTQSMARIGWKLEDLPCSLRSDLLHAGTLQHIWLKHTGWEVKEALLRNREGSEVKHFRHSEASALTLRFSTTPETWACKFS